MHVWKVAASKKFGPADCETTEDIRLMVGGRDHNHWIFEFMILRRPTYLVYMTFAKDGNCGEALNILSLRILVDLDIFQSPDSTYAGEGLHSQCPRGAVIFFKIVDSALSNYTWSEFKQDWPLFFRVGPALPYLILESEYNAADKMSYQFPMNDYWSICCWHHETLTRITRTIHGRAAEMAGDRDRALGWLISVCVRRLYGTKVWQEIVLPKRVNEK